ncbi:MAG TPA: transcription factor RcaD, partial [Allocoleopsis sp.]
METIELKFLLKLLGFPDYQAPLSKITPNSKMSATDRERICRKLRDRDLVECSYEVTKLKITSPGKSLLKSDSTELPVTDKELKVLRASEKEKISPGKTGVPAAERGEIIQRLADRGLIELETKVKEVWLSERGQECLRDEFSPKGSATISLDLLHNYLRFLRKSWRLHMDEHQ